MRYFLCSLLFEDMADDFNDGSASMSVVVGELSSESSNVFEKELPSEVCSPTPSNCSFVSEQEVTEANLLRQSPFLNLSQASPSTLSSLPRPDFLSSSIADSETSSRSSLDGSFLSKESSSEGMEKFRVRRSTRKLSSSSSDSDGSELTVGGGSLDGDEPIVRKFSKTKLPDSNLPVARPLDAPRGRIANIRRESDCSLSNEVEHERLVKTSQQVSCGFDDITLEKAVELRRRAPSASSIGEPISIVTNVFLPNSCSPSPTRVTDMHKQCYSPSTHQMVRPNIPYSASPSPTQSPTRQRLLRSLSPIATKSALKRRCATSVDEVESKRICGAAGVFVRNSTSPLVTDRTFPYPPTIPQQFAQPSSVSVNWTPSSLSAGIRRLANFQSTMERHDSDSTVNERKSVDDVDTEDVQMNELPSEVGSSQPSIITEHEHKSTSCNICTDECNCVSRTSSDEQAQQVECPYEPFLRSS